MIARTSIAQLLGAFAGLAFAGWPAARAADEPGSTPTPDAQLRKIEGIFNTDLPKTERKGAIRLTVHPHFGDFTKYSYVRLPIGVRWGLSGNTDFTATIEPYIKHGLKSGTTGTGLGDFQLEAKHNWPGWPAPDYDVGIGVNTFFPVGHPPINMTNGYNRYSPYVVLTKRMPAQPGLTLFFGTGVNLLRKSSVPGSFEDNVPHSDTVIVTPGLVYDHFPFHYTFEFSLESTSLIGRGNQQFLTLRPGFAWELPPKLKFNAKGRWVIGFGFHATFGPDGVTTGGGGKLRGEFRLKR